MYIYMNLYTNISVCLALAAFGSLRNEKEREIECHIYTPLSHTC